MRAIAFVDGQNLSHRAAAAFGYRFPNFDIEALTARICEREGWRLEQVRFYTGLPNSVKDPKWHHFWSDKLNCMKRKGTYVFSTPLRYVSVVRKTNTGVTSFPEVREKGIDIQIVMDSIRLAHLNHFDVALFFSQDSDYANLARELISIAKAQSRWIVVACAYPENQTQPNGIPNMLGIKFDKALYDRCLDTVNHFPPRSNV